jgi:hypothetical protein
VAGVQERWVRAGTFSNRIEAETASSALAARGIETRLVGDDGGGAGFPLSLEHQGMEVHLAASDLGPARQLLDLDEQASDAAAMSWPVIALIGATIVAVAVVVALSAIG